MQKYRRNWLPSNEENNPMQIDLLTPEDLTEPLQQEVARLYRQLNAENRQRPLSEVLDASNNVSVALCTIDEVPVGIALMSTYKVISGYRGLIEDVVVDASQRGQGIGRKLMERLLEEAQKMGLDEMLLFTGHHRTPAIGLYTSLGFTLRESGLYNLKFT